MFDQLLEYVERCVNGGLKWIRKYALRSWMKIYKNAQRAIWSRPEYPVYNGNGGIQKFNVYEHSGDGRQALHDRCSEKFN